MTMIALTDPAAYQWPDLPEETPMTDAPDQTPPLNHDTLAYDCRRRMLGQEKALRHCAACRVEREASAPPDSKVPEGLIAAIADPGSVLDRGHAYTETISRWAARAVLASDWFRGAVGRAAFNARRAGRIEVSRAQDAVVRAQEVADLYGTAFIMVTRDGSKPLAPYDTFLLPPDAVILDTDRMSASRQ